MGKKPEKKQLERQRLSDDFETPRSPIPGLEDVYWEDEDLVNECLRRLALESRWRDLQDKQLVPPPGGAPPRLFFLEATFLQR